MAGVFVAHCHVAHNPKIRFPRGYNGIDESFVLHPRETDATDDLMAMAAEEMDGKKGITFLPISLYCYSDGGVRHPKQGSMKVVKVSELRAYLQQLKPNDKECHVHIDLKRSWEK